LFLIIGREAIAKKEHLVVVERGGNEKFPEALGLANSDVLIKE
jgi:hypothetical protein